MQSVKLKYLAHACSLEPAVSGTMMQLRAAIPTNEPITLLPMGWAAIPTGIAVEMPPLIEALISSAPNALGSVLNSPGTIDPDYRGELSAIIINLSNDTIKISRGDHIADLRLSSFARVSFIEASHLEETVRSTEGFGSTGMN